MVDLHVKDSEREGKPDENCTKKMTSNKLLLGYKNKKSATPKT